MIILAFIIICVWQFLQLPLAAFQNLRGNAAIFAVIPSRVKSILLRWASRCFPTEKAGRQDLLSMIARPSINVEFKIGYQCYHI